MVSIFHFWFSNTLYACVCLTEAIFTVCSRLTTTGNQCSVDLLLAGQVKPFFLNSSWNYFDWRGLSVAVCLLAILKIMDNLQWKHFKELKLVDLINFWIRSQNPSSRIFYGIGSFFLFLFLPIWHRVKMEI